MSSKLGLNILKNNDLIYSKKSIPFIKNNNSHTFIIDGINTQVDLNDKSLILKRENDEFLFYLIISSEKNECTYLLKEVNTNFEIKVDYANYKFDKDKLTINYQIETDEFLTTLEILFE